MKKLVLIHGALGNRKEFDRIIPLLEDHFETYTYEIPHHGKKSNTHIAFNIKAIVEDFVDFLEETGPSIIYGFSLGGYVALCAAIQETKNIEGIITQGTKLDWSPEIAAREVKGLDIDFLKSKAAPFYDYLRSLHGDYLEDLLEKTEAFMEELGNDPVITRGGLNSIDIPVRLTRGGKDKMVSKEETINVKEMLPNGHYFEIPFLPHPLGFIKPKHIARLIEVQANSLHFKWATTAYGRTAYQTIGNSNDSDEVLIFLHEAIGSIAQWKEFPRTLSERLELPAIVLEWPGYGFSTDDERMRDHRYLHEFALSELPAFIDEVCPNKKIVLIGHSDGGTEALLYASKYDKKVSKVVTMAAHYINEPETRAGIQPAIEAFEAGKMKGLELYHGAKTEHLFYNWARTWLNDDFKNWDISNDIKGMTTPALIIQGSDDQYGTDEQVHGICQLINQGTPQFIDNCGHAPHLEQTEKVIQSIKSWSEKSR